MSKKDDPKIHTKNYFLQSLNNIRDKNLLQCYEPYVNPSP